jgi:SNF2 family DNA or RNA helicase
MIGDRCVPLDQATTDDLRSRVENAIGTGVATVPLVVEGETIPIPANHETLAAIHILEASRHPLPVKPATDDAQDSLIVRVNENEIEFEATFQVRPAPPPGLPVCINAILKPHQKDGVAWLQQAWQAGAPGVLLADDMGLGKTLQGLAFLAWLRHGMQIGIVKRGPVLIVAPTGLLENWIKEHTVHLAAPGLGVCLQAYGHGLAALRTVSPTGTPTLDTNALESADWVLTTYETVRDYDRDFGLVGFVVMLCDEAQKIKNPGVRITDAAKGMKADFRIAMTGTPVENRLSDLWCIVDGVHPGFLDDLKAFSARYEAAHDPEALKSLKRDLERPLGGRPPLLKRRMKYDHLTDLPPFKEVLIETPMPKPQAEAYRAVLDMARNSDRRGAVLEALQRLRAVSLHPGDTGNEEDERFISASARLIASFSVLDDIHSRGERVLIFVEDLVLQPRLAGIIQRRYQLPAPPMIINGQVSGKARQARVDRFQLGIQAFDAMVLSARAGGVGLTLTRANHVIHLSRWWNPAVEDQCNGRVLRIGQARPVTIHLPLAVLPAGGKSFDQNLQNLLDRKRTLMRAALVPTDETDGEHREVLDACLST